MRVPLAAGSRSLDTGRHRAHQRSVMAERVLSEEQADMIGVVREQIADPDFCAKARDGHAGDPLLHRVYQNCYGRVGLNKTIGCVQNPSVGCGPPGRRPPEAGVAQAGHGSRRRPAGMRAAKIAALRGHDVTLYEGDELGGQVLWRPGAQGETSSASGAQRRNQLAALKVPVKYGVSGDFVLEHRPDAVIVATGSRPQACQSAAPTGPTCSTSGRC